MLWDLYQHYRISQLGQQVDRLQDAPAKDVLARDEGLRLEEKLDRLAIITRALFELVQETTGISEAKLSAKVVEIDLRDGQADNKLTAKPKRCPKCEAMLSPKFGRCLFCGYRDESLGSFS